MRYEKLLEREDGTSVKIVTLVSGNVFIKAGYEVEQFALVKAFDSEEWVAYYPKTFPKNVSRQEYTEKLRPNTFFGVVSCQY